MEYVTLNNGVKMPILGFGTYFLNVSNTEEAVYNALMCGYRQLDTAKWYVNEKEVAHAIKRSNIDRKDLFITCKIESKGYHDTILDIQDTLKKLETDYLDLILIHWPSGDILGTYKALEEMYSKKITKAIGLSNFNEELCDYILQNCTIKPQINQIETHIYFQQKKMHNYLEKNNIYHESWSPFAEGLLNVFNELLIIELSKKYNKTAAQIMLRFLIQKNIIVIPRSIDINHIKENINVFDFTIDNTDIIEIEKLDKRQQLSGWPTIMKDETNY